jgi:hypothetical protein
MPGSAFLPISIAMQIPGESPVPSLRLTGNTLYEEKDRIPGLIGMFFASRSILT